MIGSRIMFNYAGVESLTHSRSCIYVDHAYVTGATDDHFIEK